MVWLYVTLGVIAVFIIGILFLCMVLGKVSLMEKNMIEMISSRVKEIGNDIEDSKSKVKLNETIIKTVNQRVDSLERSYEDAYENMRGELDSFKSEIIDKVNEKK